MFDRRTVGSLALAAALVIGGTLATGVLPPTLPYQLLAGGAIVAGFAVVLLALGEMPWSVDETGEHREGRGVQEDDEPGSRE